MFKFFDRGDSTPKTLDAFDATLKDIANAVADEIRDEIAEFVGSRGRVASAILDPNGKHFEEIPGDATRSEAYRDKLRGYLRRKGSKLAAYHGAATARDSWILWSKMLGWATLVFLICEIFNVVTCGLHKLDIVVLGEKLLVVMNVASGLLFGACVVLLCAQKYHYDNAIDARAKL